MPIVCSPGFRLIAVLGGPHSSAKRLALTALLVAFPVVSSAAPVLPARSAFPAFNPPQVGLADEAPAQVPGGASDAAASPERSTPSSAPARDVSSTRPQGKPQPLDKEGQFLLIRGLSSEVAVAKVTLPRGKHGISLDSTGKINAAKARQELKENGPAINPGTPIEITKLDFRADRLTFEINGGGKSGKHWYQHIEIDAGPAMQPIAAPQDQNQTLTYGSYVTLKFKGRVPDLSVPEAKQLLSSALDFTRHSPTVLYSPSVPPKFKEAIKNHEVLVGMDRDAVLSAKGPPDRKVRQDEPDGSEKVDWIYGLPPHVLFVTFDGDTVVRVKQY